MCGGWFEDGDTDDEKILGADGCKRVEDVKIFIESNFDICRYIRGTARVRQYKDKLRELGMRCFG